MRWRGFLSGGDFEGLTGVVFGVLAPDVRFNVDCSDDAVAAVAFGDGHDVCFRYWVHVTYGFAASLELGFLHVYGGSADLPKCENAGHARLSSVP